MRRGALADWREVIADTVPGRLPLLDADRRPGPGGADRRRRHPDRRSPARPASTPPRSTSCASSRPCSAPGRSRRCWSTCCCRRCSRSAAPRLVNVPAPRSSSSPHVAVTALGGALFGVNGVVGAFFVVPLAFAVVCSLAGAGRGQRPDRPRAGPRRPALRPRRRRLLRHRRAGRRCARRRHRAPLLTIGVGSLLYVALTPVARARAGAPAGRGAAPRLGMNVAVRTPRRSAPPRRRAAARGAREIAANADVRAVAGLAFFFAAAGGAELAQMGRSLDRRRARADRRRRRSPKAASPTATSATSTGRSGSTRWAAPSPSSAPASPPPSPSGSCRRRRSSAPSTPSRASCCGSCRPSWRRRWWPRSASPAPPSTSSSPTPTRPPSGSSSSC